MPDTSFNEFALIETEAKVSPARKNPASVAEMLAILADRMAREVPKTDAQIDAEYGEDDADDDAKWNDRDPAYLSDEAIEDRIDAAKDRRGRQFI